MPALPGNREPGRGLIIGVPVRAWLRRLRFVVALSWDGHEN